MYVSSVSVTCMKSRGCRLRWRRALSSIKKGVFLDVEGHVLEWRRACSRMEKGMFLKGEGRILEWEGCVLERSGAGG